ncbi:Uncharacterized protein TCM_010697 [Theobroma cacao]|uniref:RRM domain-containing protein n=1 Tax=Theobroma cacao TaxID=3641 RepID=A0A061E707_THECC|nr:Uncharacterized protein TCM_010697 [Theobroma cacao]
MFVENLAKEVKWRQLKNLFDEFGVGGCRCIHPKDKSQLRIEICFVRYRDVREMSRTIFLGHRKEVEGRWIRVLEAEKPRDDGNGGEKMASLDTIRCEPTFRVDDIGEEIEEKGLEDLRFGKLVLEKVRAKFVAWKAKLLSFDGKSEERTRKNSVKVFGGVTDLKRKIHYLKWNKVCNYRKYGDIGVIDLKIQNYALLNKWMWWYGKEKGNL